eukprot:365253-Chlamydomonas_euryale.AAC.14
MPQFDDSEPACGMSAGSFTSAASGDQLVPRVDHEPTAAEKAVEKAVLDKAQAEIELEGPNAVPCSIGNVPKTLGKPGAVNLQDFEMMRLVGQGAFGKVRHKKSGVIYALKVMRKAKIHEAEHVDYVKSERDVLTSVTHPYIVALRFSFQTPSKLYLVLDFLNGGHLFFNLYREGVFSEDVARLYSAEIVCLLKAIVVYVFDVVHACDSMSQLSGGFGPTMHIPTRAIIFISPIVGASTTWKFLHLFTSACRRAVCSFGVKLSFLMHAAGHWVLDLKPENVLLDAEGHIRLTDFGLAKEYARSSDGGAADRSNSFIGTMEYMAPEIINGLGHDMRVDWWSTGILLYEMLCGLPPFRNKSRSALQREIIGGKIKYPKFLSSNALSLLKGLLTRDPTKRLGCGPDGGEAIKRHPFFKQISWTKLDRREIQSKFKPNVQCHKSTENFDRIWTDQLPEDSPCATPGSHIESMFKGFTYVDKNLLLSPASDGKAGIAYRAEHD